MQGTLCQVLDSIGYDSGFVLSGCLPAAHLSVQGSYEQAHCRPYLEFQDRPCRAGQFPAPDHPGGPGLG
ncbi:hypothetical protein EMIT0P12_30398 [Pseudomonas sp. IT-P12]